MVDLFNNISDNNDDDDLIVQNQKLFYSTGNTPTLNNTTINTSNDNIQSTDNITAIDMDFTLSHVIAEDFELDNSNNTTMVNNTIPSKEDNSIELDIPVSPIDDKGYLKSLEDEFLDREKVQEVSHKHLDLTEFNYEKGEISLAVEEDLSDSYPFFFIKGKLQKVQVQNILNENYVKRGNIPIKYKNKDLLLTICSVEPIPENVKNLLRTLNNNLYYVKSSNDVKMATPLDFIKNAILDIE